MWLSQELKSNFVEKAPKTHFFHSNGEILWNSKKYMHKERQVLCISFFLQIAAASLEKLFQQLTSPQYEHQDFMRVFLLTHSCFTTPKDVLTALLNCIKSPEDYGERHSLVSRV